MYFGVREMLRKKLFDLQFANQKYEGGRELWMSSVINLTQQAQIIA